MSNDKKISIVKLLDLVLEWFCMEPEEWKDLGETREGLISGQVCVYIINYNPELTEVPNFIINIDLVIEQLAQDGYITKTPIFEYFAYSWNLKGKLFCAQGGYRAEIENSEKLKNLNYQKLIGDVQKLTNELGDYPTTKLRANYAFYFSIVMLIAAVVTLFLKCSGKTSI